MINVSLFGMFGELKLHVNQNKNTNKNIFGPVHEAMILLLNTELIWNLFYIQ